MEIAGEVGDGREVVEVVQRVDPDVVLLDLQMPGLDGLNVLQQLQQFAVKLTENGRRFLVEAPVVATRFNPRHADEQAKRTSDSSA